MSSELNPQNNQNPPFVKKAVEPPLLDSEIRQQLAPSAQAPESGGFKAFYCGNKIYFWAILGGLAVIASLAFFAFRKVPPPVVKEANVSVTIEAPETVPSGGEAVYKIKIENQDAGKLVDLQLELAYPEGVTYISSSPKARNLSGSIFGIPDLIKGQNAVVIVKAKATGNINEEKKLAAKLHYRYSNFSSEFVKQGEFAIRLAASDVAMEISGPASVNNAQLVFYTLKYRNNSRAEIKNSRIKFAYPDGFSFVSASPPPDSDNNFWNAGNFSAGAEGAIEVRGSFRAAGAGEGKTFIAEFLVQGQDGQYYKQADVSFVTSIANLPLVVSQELENDAGGVVNPGGFLNFRLEYQNTANTVASGVNIVAAINSKAADLSTLRAENGQISGGTILWNASTVPGLENLAPNESGVLSYTVMLKDPATRDSSKNLTVVSSIKIKSNEYETYFPGNELGLKISSPARVSSALKYAGGALPPQVGKETVYNVSFSLANATNDFSDGLLTAFIPLASGSFIKAGGGDMNFDQATGKLTWSFGNLPAHTGQFSQAKTLQFQVKIIPSSQQVGQSPILVKDIKLTAKDVFTSEDINLSADDITTANLAGEEGYRNGQVAP